MASADHPEDDSALRTDAARNRRRIIDTARKLFVDQGIDVPLESIARGAEVGIATLYRRFSDRDELVRAVASDAFHQVAALALDLAGSTAPDDPMSLLAVFVDEVTARRLAPLMTSLLPRISPLEDHPNLLDDFSRASAAISTLVASCHVRGELREDATADDIMLLLALLGRPLDGAPLEFTAAATPRLMSLAMQGLKPRQDSVRLPPGPGLR